MGERDERMTLSCGKHQREVIGSMLLGELHPCCLEVLVGGMGWLDGAGRGGQAGNWASLWHGDAQGMENRVIIVVLLKEHLLLRVLSFETNYPCSTYFIF